MEQPFDNNQITSNIKNDNDVDNNNLLRKTTVQIVADKSALHCKNGCGFYGNREWDGYCSICYKEIRQLQQQQNNILHSESMVNASTSSLNLSPQSSSSSSSIPMYMQKLIPETLNRAHSVTLFSNSSLSNATGSLSFRKFEEKKRQQSDKKSLKSIFKRASTFREYRSSSASSSQYSNNGENISWDFLEKPLLFGEEVISKLFPDFAIRDVNSNVMKCVDKANKMLNRGCSIEEITELLHDFYSLMENRFKTHSQYKDVNSTQYNQLINQTEKILMSKLYLNLFTRVQSEEEERDLELQKKIRNLNWIMSNHLDIDINLRHPKVKDLMDQAITEIIEVDSKHVPFEKLESIVNCSKTIFEMLQINHIAAISADQFLPALVFIIIHANPPLLQSNIKFITRFSTPSRLMTGEAGYYFTNLCCATTFIEKISGESLNMSESDFQSYITGEAQPPGYYKQSFLCEPFRILNSNHTIINDTMKRNVQWNENIECLDKRLDRFEEMLNTKCTNALNTSKQIIIQNSYYKLFDKDDINVSLMPKYFQNMYREYRKQKLPEQKSVNDDDNNDNNVLIDLVKPSALNTIDISSLNICDSSLNSIDFQSISNNELKINSNNNNNNNNNTNDNLIEKKLPNPLGSEFISNHVINDSNETTIPEITK